MQTFLNILMLIGTLFLLAVVLTFILTLVFMWLFDKTFELSETLDKLEIDESQDWR